MIYWFLIITIFLFGLAIGSFINALEYRIEEKKSISGRSFCPHCKHQLAWYDLVPIFSFIFLRGECRYCKKKISWQYPIVELLTGTAFVAMAWRLLEIPAFAGMTRDFIVGGSVTNRELLFGIIPLLCLFFISFCLILVALHDQKTSYVLSGYVYAAIAATTVYLMIIYPGAWELQRVWFYILPNIISAVIAALPFALLYLFSKGEWMGAGDIEIAVLLGFLLGWPNFLVALYFAFIVGSLWGIVKVYMLKNAKLKSEIPFAPFLIAGIVFAFIFAEQLVSLYVKIFLG